MTVKSRRSRKRDKVLAIFRNARYPLLPTEVLERGKKELPSLSLGTVYRHIKELTDAGSIQAIAFPLGTVRYAWSDEAPQYYLQCKRCHSIYNIELDRHSREILHNHGFEAIKFVTAACKTCPDCRRASSESLRTSPVTTAR
jgi:Fe2+ or Zn2+ uptake regulation protein